MSDPKAAIVADLVRHGTDPAEAARVADGLARSHAFHWNRGQRNARCRWCLAIPLAGPGYHVTAAPGTRVEALPDPEDREWWKP